MIGVILNPRAGYVAHNGLLQTSDLIRAALPTAQIHVLASTDHLPTVVRQMVTSGARVVAAAGGDGTVGAVAATLLGTPTPLGVLPAGTLNHFARDVGVGRAMGQALHTLAHGQPQRVDMAQVNDRLFLNNSSIGLYPTMVELRERHEGRVGKWRALLYASWVVVRHRHPVRVHVRSLAPDGRPLPDGLDETISTYLLFVGNNRYELNLLRLGLRARLDEGTLGGFALTVPRRRGLLRHLYHYFIDHHPDRAAFRLINAPELLVDTSRSRVSVACDGEVLHMTPPLLYRVLPRALAVIVPVPPPAESRAAPHPQEAH